MKIMIPMAGVGSRFRNVGIAEPKPIIKIFDRYMIEYALDAFMGFPDDTEYIFIVLKEHVTQHRIDKVLSQIMKDRKYKIVVREKLSEGAAITVMDAIEELGIEKDDDELIIANCDQKIIWDSKAFLHYRKHKNVILTFWNNHPKWSYAEVANDRVVRVAEKDVISEHATVGIYHFDSIRCLYAGIYKMIKKNLRVNNEFYLCPVYNELIENGEHVSIFPVDRMFGLGTPEDLENFKNVMVMKN